MNPWHTKVGAGKGQDGAHGRVSALMILKYQTGEEIKKGDRVLFHGEPGQIELVVAELGDVETDWFMKEHGGGVMILDKVAGRTFIPADQIVDLDERLEFVSRTDET
jgi:hypothetical protein